MKDRRKEDVLLEVEGLRTYFEKNGVTVKAVDGISFTIHRGEIIGIVGESGSGKSVTCLSILRLIQQAKGRIIFRGKDILSMKEKELEKIRGAGISMVFQDASFALNPYRKISSQIIETIRMHQKLTKAEARQKAIEALALVGLPDPQNRMDDYPDQFSGGMKTRIMLAIALCCGAELIIADEPTSSLDVTVQATILDLIKSINEKNGTSILLISHDLNVIAELCNRVHVMYKGHIMESAIVSELFDRPLHPYTRSLLSASRGDNEQVPYISGEEEIESPCPFYPRCQERQLNCLTSPPPTLSCGEQHLVSCWKYSDGRS